MSSLLSNLIKFFARGGEVLIMRAGQPVASLKKDRVPGSAKDLFVVPDDFNDPLPPEIQRYFDGEDDDTFW
jgi:antitoxin (DNA-binding transcriptional repressor) of toxin-antitoxin stability system